MLLTTSQAAKVLEIDVKTLRFWDQSNCLPVPARLPGKWRRFSFQDLVRISIVDRMVRLGLPVCFATDRLEESVGPLPVKYLGKANNAAIGIASFRGARVLVAVKYQVDPLLDSSFNFDYWADRPAYSVELVDGKQMPSYMGLAKTLPVPIPEAVSIIRIDSVIERIQERLEYFRVDSGKSRRTSPA